jgi:CheY-like chemotaxis protein
MHDLEKTRILIVDDEASFTRLLKLNLDHTGKYLVRAVNRPREALLTASEFEPDIVLMDVLMPECDGGDLAADFQANPKLNRVPVVFVTAAVKPQELAAHGGCIGGLPFLSKPVQMPAVIDCIERTCRTARTR